MKILSEDQKLDNASTSKAFCNWPEVELTILLASNYANSYATSTSMEHNE